MTWVLLTPDGERVTVDPGTMDLRYMDPSQYVRPVSWWESIRKYGAVRVVVREAPPARGPLPPAPRADGPWTI